MWQGLNKRCGISSCLVHSTNRGPLRSLYRMVAVLESDLVVAVEVVAWVLDWAWVCRLLASPWRCPVNQVRYQCSGLRPTLCMPQCSNLHLRLGDQIQPSSFHLRLWISFVSTMSTFQILEYSARPVRFYDLLEVRSFPVFR